MSDVGEHYARGGPYQKVSDALEQLVPGGGPITLEQLGGFDDFHTAGRGATVHMADLLSPGPDETVLDAGCGLGGPARYLADRFGCTVVGFDLTPELVAVAQMINSRTGMSDRVDVRVGDITELDLADASVDHVWTQHVAMNIADREGLYREIRRVMRAGGRFALFDVVDGGGGEVVLPVPWATMPEHSHLVTAEALRSVVEAAGFEIHTWEDPTKPMVEATKAMLSGPPPAEAPPILSPGLFIDDMQTKGPNYMRNMEEGRTALVMAVFTAI